MPPRRKSETSSPSAELSFEDAMAEVESLVESMEMEQLPLEQLIASYERGAKLIRGCNQILNKAKKRIELITLNANESELPTPSSDSKLNKPAKEDPLDLENDHDITLF